jgi:hypothetical protein
MKCCKCGPRTHKTLNVHNVLYGDNYLLISSPAFLSLLEYKSFMLRNGIAYYSSKKTCIAQAFLLSFKKLVRLSVSDAYNGTCYGGVHSARRHLAQRHSYCQSEQRHSAQLQSE